MTSLTNPQTLEEFFELIDVDEELRPKYRAWIRQIQEREMSIGIGMLRQWLNEDRITDPRKMITNENIKMWLFSDISDRIKKL